MRELVKRLREEWPHASFDRLVVEAEAAIEPHDTITVERGALLDAVQTGTVHIVYRGACRVEHRRTGLTMGIVHAPYVAGLLEALNGDCGLVYESKATSAALAFDTPMWNALVERRGLWKEVAHVLAIYLEALSVRTAFLTASTAYESVCNALQLLDSHPPEIKADLTAVSFVLERTKLSRSIVAKIVSDLRAGGYIEVDRGRLMTIVRAFPLRY
ncbi:MAG TPA: helix-turn-helix domain-containing protein [Pararobbsia sp.]|nr:helix-turn-helix domain-containing protein [Pararobbsia sp.]